MSVLGEEAAAAIRERFELLVRDVPLRLELGPPAEAVTVLAGGREIDFEAEARKVAEAVAELSDRVTLEVAERTEPGRFPALDVAGALRYEGLPWGYELGALVGAIAEAGAEAPSLLPASVAALRTLEHDVALEVWVTPT